MRRLQAFEALKGDAFNARLRATAATISSACASVIAIGLPSTMCLPARARPDRELRNVVPPGAAIWTMSTFSLSSSS